MWPPVKSATGNNPLSTAEIFAIFPIILLNLAKHLQYEAIWAFKSWQVWHLGKLKLGACEEAKSNFKHCTISITAIEDLFAAVVNKPPIPIRPSQSLFCSAQYQIVLIHRPTESTNWSNNDTRMLAWTALIRGAGDADSGQRMYTSLDVKLSWHHDVKFSQSTK